MEHKKEMKIESEANKIKSVIALIGWLQDSKKNEFPDVNRGNNCELVRVSFV